MKLHNLKKKKNKEKKRKGRGESSGLGKTAGRGSNGQKSRSGKGVRLGFEGGQMPLLRRIPKKRGFQSRRIKPEIVDLNDLNNFQEGTKVSKKDLFEKGLIKNPKSKVKILAVGELKLKNLEIEADFFSSKAKAILKKKAKVNE